MASGTEKQNIRNNTITINKVRVLFRNNRYLSSPKLSREHTNLDGTITLYEDLVNFSEIASGNIACYVDAAVNQKEGIKIKAVPITEEDYNESNKIESLGKDEIKVKIFEVIDKFDSENASLQEDIFRKKVHDKNKLKYIQFYYELYELLDDLYTSRECTEDEE